MIRDQPHGADLLAEASRVLQANILPHLTSKKRYDALMVLRAMDLVERELRADHKMENKLKQQLFQLTTFAGSSSDCFSALSSCIRKGTFDASKNTHNFLLLITAYKLKETDSVKVSKELEIMLDALSVETPS